MFRARGVKLAPRDTLHILDAMYRYVILVAIWIASANPFAQDAATIAAQREAEERERRMSAMMTRLEESNNVQQKRISDLIKEVSDLRRQLVEVETRFKNAQIGVATQSDLRKAYDKMAEIEKNRQADNNLVKEQFIELKKLLDRPPVVIPAAPTPRTERSERGERDRGETKAPRDNTSDEEPQQFTGDYFGYKIKSGDRLTQVIAAFNAKLKEEGKNKAPITLDMVKKANPKMNPNNLVVGREIRIPVPPDR